MTTSRIRTAWLREYPNVTLNGVGFSSMHRFWGYDEIPGSSCQTFAKVKNAHFVAICELFDDIIKDKGSKTAAPVNSLMQNLVS